MKLDKDMIIEILFLIVLIIFLIGLIILLVAIVYYGLPLFMEYMINFWEWFFSFQHRDYFRVCDALQNRTVVLS